MAVLTMLAFVVAGLLGRAHEATTSHVRCAEHGELIHSAPMLVLHQLPRTAQPALGEAAPATGPSHEHCELACASRVLGTTAPLFALTSVTHAATDVPDARPRLHDPHHHALYRTAPKTSPPVA
jgi:hypothetical protein